MILSFVLCALVFGLWSLDLSGATQLMKRSLELFKPTPKPEGPRPQHKVQSTKDKVQTSSLPILFFPQQEIFQKRVMRGEARDADAGEAVAEAALENEAAQERGGRGGGDFER